MLATQRKPDDNTLPLNTIIQGDCVAVMERMPPASVDLIFADPPYNLQLSKTLYRPDQSHVKGVDEDWDKFQGNDEYDAFTQAWLSAARRVLKPNGAIWVIGSYHNIYRMGYWLAEMGFWILNDVVWQKPNAMPNFRGTRLQNQTEILLWAGMAPKAKYTFNYAALKNFNDDKQLGNIWEIPLCRGPERVNDARGDTLHPTQKPEALLYRVLLASTNPGDVVLDPFFGTGTTGAAAKKLGRHFIGIEQDENYIAAAQARIDVVQPVDTGTLTTPNKRTAPRVAFGEVLAAGLIKAGDVFTNPKKNYKAVVQADASLIGEDGVRGSIHKLGALHQKAASCNGWDYWHFNGASIDALRQMYLQAKQAG
ncbi:MAG: site-specific DNA-methyltransferase [Bdellovibrionales bacterium]